VRPLLVVLPLPRDEFPPRVPQIRKPTHIQALIPQPAVEAFYVPVLLRFSHLNVHQLDSLSMYHARKCRLINSGPLSQLIASGLSRPVTSESSPGPASLADSKTLIYFQRQTFPHASIFHRQHPDRSAAGHRHRARNPPPIPGLRCQRRTRRTFKHQPLRPSCATVSPASQYTRYTRL
jgi:hypothetical protein